MTFFKFSQKKRKFEDTHTHLYNETHTASIANHYTFNLTLPFTSIQTTKAKKKEIIQTKVKENFQEETEFTKLFFFFLKESKKFYFILLKFYFI